MVLTVFHIITGLTDGGAEAVLSRLCLETRGIKHVVVSLTGEGTYGPRLRREGVEVHALDMPRGRVSPRGLVQLFRLLRRSKPDVVQTWMYHADLLGGVAARLAGYRNVFWNVRHSDLAAGATGRSTRLVAELCARLSRFVPHRIVTCSERAREVHAAIGYADDKFVLIPNGFSLDRFAPQPEAGLAFRQSLGIKGDERVLGLVARWNAQKDHATLLEAVGKLGRDDVHLVLAGTGCDAGNSELTQLIARHAGSAHVHRLGRRDDIPAIMSGLDVHVLSSSHGEAFPNVVAEAMACGTPCVVTDVGDAAFIVGDTGWVVPPNDVGSLSKAILLALDEREGQDWGDRQRAGRDRIVAEFSLALMVSRYCALWGAKPV